MTGEVRSCRGCMERHRACWGDCEAYRNWKEEQEEKRRDRRKEEETDLLRYKQEGKQRYYRRMHLR